MKRGKNKKKKEIEHNNFALNEVIGGNYFDFILKSLKCVRECTEE